MSVRSHEAFMKQLKSCKRGSDAKRIYTLLSEAAYKMKMPKLSLEDIKQLTWMKHQTVSARLSDLCDIGVIYEDDAGYFHITPLAEIQQRALSREDARYKKWKKLGEKNGWFGQMKIS